MRPQLMPAPQDPWADEDQPVRPPPTAQRSSSEVVRQWSRYARGVRGDVVSNTGIRRVTPQRQAALATEVAATPQVRPTYSPIVHQTPALASSPSVSAVPGPVAGTMEPASGDFVVRAKAWWDSLSPLGRAGVLAAAGLTGWAIYKAVQK